MGRKAMWGAVAVATMIGLPTALAAQAQSLKDFQVADAEQMKTKFVGLAEAIPADKYDWRPMEGTRSVKEVLALTAAEANLFPRMWGVAPPTRAAASFNDEMARVTAMSHHDLIAELGRSFDYLITSLRGMDDASRSADGRTFGQAMKVDAGISLAMSDMHEHLGQLIAYARSNEIVPPWSRGGM